MLDTIAWWRWLLLGLFFAILCIVWWWAQLGELKRRFERKKDGLRLKIVERRFLGPKSSLFLVEADGQSFLLAQSGTSTAWQPLAPSPSTKKAEK